MIKGMAVARYHEETLLGTGGMAEVWKRPARKARWR